MKEYEEKSDTGRMFKIFVGGTVVAVGSSYLTHISPDNSAMAYLYGWTTGAAFCIAVFGVIGSILRFK